MKIKNSQALAKSPLRKDALAIVEAGLFAIDTQKAIGQTVKLENNTLFVKDEKIDLSAVGRVVVVGVGKCSIDAALAFEKILGNRLDGGMVIDVRECPNGLLQKIRPYRGFHPMPQQENIDATKDLIALLKDLNEQDLALIVVSGGGSTLLCSPDDLTCQDEAMIIQSLSHAGANIQQLNTVRKHLSYARGGHLAKYAFPAKIIGLIFSDVVGDDLQFIASGPTVKDTTTIEQAKDVLARYFVLENTGLDVCNLIETPKEDKYFKNVKNIIIVSNTVALEAMSKTALQLGYSAKICDRCLSGEARKIGEMIAAALHNSPPKTALLYGGETTVTVTGKGKGGRNQELTLAAMAFVMEGELILSINTDGRDNSDHAGALCDRITSATAKELGLEPEKFLLENDSYNFFKTIGDFLDTGDTGSNVSDIMIAIKN